MQLSKIQIETFPVVGQPVSGARGLESGNRTGFGSEIMNLISSVNLPPRRVVLLLALVSTVALAASSYLAWVAFTSSKIAGCGGGRLFNCGEVISSRWSLWFGIPVSVLAASLYLLLGACLGIATLKRSPDSKPLLWFAISVLALSAGMAAVWFVSLQVFKLGHLCTYCIIAHACGLVAAATILYCRPNGWIGIRYAAMVAIPGFALLAGVQLASEDPATFKIERFDPPAAQGAPAEFEAPVFESPSSDTNGNASFRKNISPRIAATVALLRGCQLNRLLAMGISIPQQESEGQRQTAPKKIDVEQNRATSEKPRRFVLLNGATTKLDVTQWPIAGSTTAKYIFVEMFDYSCPHCRSTHNAIKGASKALDGDMAVIVLPIPLSAACNSAIQATDPKFRESCEIAKLAVAVWRVNPAKFTEFHNWLISTETAQTYAQAKTHAEAMVGAEKLDNVLASDVPAKYVAQQIELYKLAGAGNVPKLIFPTTSIVGEFSSVDGLVQIIKSQIK